LPQLPPEYPFKPPHIVFLTPSGRFETHTKICLSFTAFHPELWQPAWGIRLILEALIAFLPTPADGAVGSLDWTSEERKRTCENKKVPDRCAFPLSHVHPAGLAKKSVSYCCPRCGPVASLLKKPEKSSDADTSSKSLAPRFEKEIEQLRLAQIANESPKTNDGDDNGDAKAKAKPRPQQAEDTPALVPSTVATALVPTTQDSTESGDQDPTEEANVPPANDKDEGRDDGEDEQKIQAGDIPQRASLGGGEPLAEEATTPTTTTTTTTTTTPQQTIVEDSSWLTDPILNVAIVLLGIVIFLLGRKGKLLYLELRELDAELAEYGQP